MSRLTMITKKKLSNENALYRNQYLQLRLICKDKSIYLSCEVFEEIFFDLHCISCLFNLKDLLKVTQSFLRFKRNNE